MVWWCIVFPYVHWVGEENNYDYLCCLVFGINERKSQISVAQVKFTDANVCGSSVSFSLCLTGNSKQLCVVHSSR